MSELGNILAQYPDSFRVAIALDLGEDIGLNVGQLTVLLARSEALYSSQARLSEAVKVLEEAKTWHEEQDKSLSKQPPTHGPSGNQWARLQHREQIDILEAFLATLGEET